MPTATKTISSTSYKVIPLKGSMPTAPDPSATTAPDPLLISLYNSATRAFLHRDVLQAHSLLDSAFTRLPPPKSVSSDELSSQRRKWDLLRITLETTIYASPPESLAADSLPPALRANLILSAPHLINNQYKRSLDLFTPSSYIQKSNAAFLPSQILVTLVLSSLKLGCADVGRTMVEEWLARRGTISRFSESEDKESYAQVLDMYCLHVLPRLEQWDYTREFLDYEGELEPLRREAMKASLADLHSRALSSQQPPSPPSSVLPGSSPRSASPAPSTSSSSSSLSTMSNHTVVPHAPRHNGAIPSSSKYGSTSLSSRLSSSSLASNSTVTARTKTTGTISKTSAQPNGRGNHHSIYQNNRSREASPSSMLRPPRSTIDITASATRRNPTTYALIRATIAPYLSTSRSKLGTLLLVFVVFPIMSLVVRMLRGRRRLSNAANGLVMSEEVRRSLMGSRTTLVGSTAAALKAVFGEVIRVVGDTVRMGGSGLV